MKKLLLSFIIVCGISAYSNAQISVDDGGIYYEDDYCGDYFENCSATVIKCRFYGISPCHVSIQVPCEDACGID
ncbi:hypothetical protein SAMN04488104_100275 [Algoriphagus faecimaris]|uniref:Uncharacterized protein n=1 Tax=Algoriphagus faecimaris TaxID=686796 RepID=A0A1G6MUF7_9BACT|nr:hypothetical protein [Algoriphagus faecimaris]SDC59238.1 hypothetical protein SAMN04488104_100275 [Algoriphagus faecimaris]